MKRSLSLPNLESFLGKITAVGISLAITSCLTIESVQAITFSGSGRSRNEGADFTFELESPDSSGSGQFEIQNFNFSFETFSESDGTSLGTTTVFFDSGILDVESCCEAPSEFGGFQLSDFDVGDAPDFLETYFPGENRDFNDLSEEDFLQYSLRVSGTVNSTVDEAKDVNETDVFLAFIVPKQKSLEDFFGENIAGTLLFESSFAEKIQYTQPVVFFGSLGEAEPTPSTSVPESDAAISLVTLGGLGAGLLLKRKINKR